MDTAKQAASVSVVEQHDGPVLQKYNLNLLAT